MMEKMTKLNDETKVAVEGVLKPDQAKRLKQITYQIQGPAAFEDKEVQTALKFTDEQKEKVKAIVDEFNKDRMEIMRSGFQPGGDREEMQKRREENMKKVAALTKETDEKVGEKLTDEQKKLWKDMIGEKVDVAKIMAGNQRPMRRDN